MTPLKQKPTQLQVAAEFCRKGRCMHAPTTLTAWPIGCQVAHVLGVRTVSGHQPHQEGDTQWPTASITGHCTKQQSDLKQSGVLVVMGKTLICQILPKGIHIWTSLYILFQKGHSYYAQMHQISKWTKKERSVRIRMHFSLKGMGLLPSDSNTSVLPM